jgi:hypothetical protein
VGWVGVIPPARPHASNKEAVAANPPHFAAVLSSVLRLNCRFDLRKGIVPSPSNSFVTYSHYILSRGAAPESSKHWRKVGVETEVGLCDAWG